MPEIAARARDQIQLLYRYPASPVLSAFGTTAVSYTAPVVRFYSS